MNISSKKFQKFMNSKDSVLQWEQEDEKEVLVKVETVLMSGEMIQAVYYGKKYDGIPNQMELIGYFMPGKKIAVISQYQFKAAFPNVDVFVPFQINIDNEKRAYVQQLVDSMYDGLPEGNVESYEIEKAFKDGKIPKTEDEIKKAVVEQALKRECYYSFDERLAIFFENKSVIENVIKDIFNEDEIKENLSCEKSYNKALSKKIATTDFDCVREVKKVLRKEEMNGKKTVTATFNFGYEKVTKKINTYNEYSWMPTYKDVQEFEEHYGQPASMKSSDFESFIPYIEEITSRNKVLYKRDIKIEHELENEFLIMLKEYQGNTKDENDEIVNKMIGMIDAGVDLSILVWNNKPILSWICELFYTTKEMFVLLYKSGATLTEEQKNKLCEKLKESMKYNSRVTRNAEDILKFLER